jgi:hypothetical protein
MLDLLIDAIARRRLIEFDYRGHHRIAEPHIYGRLNDADQMLVFQIGGTSSSGGLPEWRLINLSGVINLRLLEDGFDGPRAYQSGPHSTWAIHYAIVN